MVRFPPPKSHDTFCPPLCEFPIVVFLDIWRAFNFWLLINLGKEQKSRTYGRTRATAIDTVAPVRFSLVAVCARSRSSEFQFSARTVALKKGSLLRF